MVKGKARHLDRAGEKKKNGKKFVVNNGNLPVGKTRWGGKKTPYRGAIADVKGGRNGQDYS